MNVCVKWVAKELVSAPLQEAQFDLPFPGSECNTFWIPLPQCLLKEEKINCKQQEITVIQTVEISVLSKLLFLAGDVLSSKVQRK